MFCALQIQTPQGSRFHFCARARARAVIKTPVVMEPL